MGETPETLMHVASLLYFTYPEGVRRGVYLRRLVDDLRAAPIEAPWFFRLQTRVLMRQPVHRWVEDDAFDIDYHVRHSALPAPGGERELGVLVSRLHSNQLDFRRPPWEMHVIEGLSGGRFAIYTKIHHSLVDGFTGMRILQRGLSTDPDDREHPFFFSTRKPPRPEGSRPEVDPVGDVASILRSLTASVGSTPSVLKALVETQLGRGSTPTKAVTSYAAPDSILNSRTGRSRRFATQEYDLARLRSVASARDATLNDVLMAICAGGLRRWLADQQALPERPLVAFVPVNVRPPESEGGGNAVGATLVSLATDVDDPLARLRGHHRVVEGGQGAHARDERGCRDGLQRAAARPRGAPGRQGDERAPGPRAAHAQRLHLQRARPAGPAAPAGCPPGGDLPHLDPRALDGAQHHGALVRREARRRLHR